MGGMVSSIAGLGDATEAAAVGPAVETVFVFTLIPLTLAAAFMILLIRMGSRGH